jgi:hypothetical protein
MPDSRGSNLPAKLTLAAGDYIIIVDNSVIPPVMKRIDASAILDLIPEGGGGDVDSVNGQSGVVVLDSDDIDDTEKTHKFMTQAERTKLAGISAGAGNSLASIRYALALD